jgi:hypothetical protein
MPKPLTIGEFSLSPSSQRGMYTVMGPDGKPTGYTIEKHKYWLVRLDGEALRQGRYVRLEQALAAVVSRMRPTGEYTD